MQSGNELRDMRLLAGWSLEQTCDGSGGVVEISMLSRAERNLAELRVEQREAIERALRSQIASRSRKLAGALAAWRAPAQTRAAISA